MTCCWSHLHAVINVECCGRYWASPRYIIPSLLIPRYFSDTGKPCIPARYMASRERLVCRQVAWQVSRPLRVERQRPRNETIYWRSRNAEQRLSYKPFYLTRNRTYRNFWHFSDSVKTGARFTTVGPRSIQMWVRAPGHYFFRFSLSAV